MDENFDFIGWKVWIDGFVCVFFYIVVDVDVLFGMYCFGKVKCV